MATDSRQKLDTVQGALKRIRQALEFVHTELRHRGEWDDCPDISCRADRQAFVMIQASLAQAYEATLGGNYMFINYRFTSDVPPSGRTYIWISPDRWSNHPVPRINEHIVVEGKTCLIKGVLWEYPGAATLLLEPQSS